ncbi:MAG: endonuclease/exonuclease/phosphatase family protein [bacterium]|nr:endonuclease/exonuclease/phosphatase family protein [bacterium]
MARPQISFATFNLRNLQLPGAPTYPGVKPLTKSQYAAKIDWIAGMVRNLEADVFGFQELWDAEALEDVFLAAGVRDGYDLVTSDQTGRINNAVAVRAPHQRRFSTWIDRFPDDFTLRKRGGATGEDPDLQIAVDIDNFSRPVLRVTVRPEIDGVDEVPSIAVFVTHLKSKLPTRLDAEDRKTPGLTPSDRRALGAALSTIRRTAEAAALRMVINSAMSSTAVPVVVMGDVNDGQLSNTVNILSDRPKYRLFASSGLGRRSSNGLYSTATMQEYRSLRDVYYTYIFEGIRESLDHVLVSQHFYDYSDNRVWSFNEMRILNDHLEDEDEDIHLSDHAVVKATFDYNPAE